MIKIKSFFVIAALAMLLGACSTLSATQKANNEIGNQEWQLISAVIDGEVTPLNGERITLIYKDDRLAGSSAVNRYSGPVVFTDDNALSFSAAIITTRMAGSPEAMQLEDKYLSVLPNLNHFELEDGILTLTAGRDNILKFKSILDKNVE